VREQAEGNNNACESRKLLWERENRGRDQQEKGFIWQLQLCLERGGEKKGGSYKKLGREGGIYTPK
jgi:hypothetical protein